MRRKRCVSVFPFVCRTNNEKQTVVSIDLYLVYLRAAFHACYYCAVITDHLEELQRKCIKHERKPLVSTSSESKSLETEHVEKEKKGDDSEKDGAEQEKEREKDGKERRDDKRNGDSSKRITFTLSDLNSYSIDGRWLEWLDSKIALLINRDGVDPRDYGGKLYEEYATVLCFM
jgi:hypothetical protein